MVGDLTSYTGPDNVDSAASLPMSAVDLREDCLNPKCRERSLTVALALMVVKEMWPNDDDNPAPPRI